MSPSTLLVIIVVAVVLDWKYRIIRWPLSFSAIAAISYYYKTNDGIGAFAVFIPSVIVLATIRRIIKNYRERSEIRKVLLENGLG